MMTDSLNHLVLNATRNRYHWIAGLLAELKSSGSERNPQHTALALSRYV